MNQFPRMITIDIDGERFDVASDQHGSMNADPQNSPDIKDQSNDTYQFTDGSVTHRIKVLSYDVQTLQVTVLMNGQVKQVRIIRELDLMIEKMGMNASQSKKQSLMIAPMPGLVTDIKVAPGDYVEKGTPLLILEAMKMENVISAPHEAIIKELKVTIGQAVERGLPLLEFS